MVFSGTLFEHLYHPTLFYPTFVSQKIVRLKTLIVCCLTLSYFQLSNQMNPQLRRMVNSVRFKRLKQYLLCPFLM